MVAAIVAAGHGLGFFAGPVVDGLGPFRDFNVHLGFDRAPAEYLGDPGPVQIMAKKNRAMGSEISPFRWGNH